MRHYVLDRPELPVLDARTDPRIVVALDRVIHMGSGTGTYGRSRVKWEDDAEERRSRLGRSRALRNVGAVVAPLARTVGGLVRRAAASVVAVLPRGNDRVKKGV